MKPRTGDGPLEVTKEGRGIVMRVPLEGGGRLVVELSADEAAQLSDVPPCLIFLRIRAARKILSHSDRLGRLGGG